MATSKKPKNVNDISKEAMAERLKTMLTFRTEFLKDVANAHVRLQRGNDKTGKSCWTVSLIPIADCPNCLKCSAKCYDLRNDCWRFYVQKDRAKNSAIHQADPNRYWSEINAQIKANGVTELRLNVGGDLTDDDFIHVAELGRKNPDTLILFFTKNYNGINRFLDHNVFPENVKPILSRWIGMEYANPYNLPCSHVLWADGKTTAPDYGAYYCGGNCSECAINGEGCWNLQKGESVIFNAH